MESELKNDGRYTAYHVYQCLSFTEANEASTVPYRTAAFKCAHSQRGYLFQFESMPERNHFDAANTSCCDEPVLNFANKPQYASASKPMKPRDCRKIVRTSGCEILDVSVDEVPAICASDSPRLQRLRIKCPTLCVEFSNMPPGETFSGKYGKFRSLGSEPGDVMILEYTPNQNVLDGIYSKCSGSKSLTEYFCGGHTLDFTVRAGLDHPEGCGCDCCGTKGIFPAPSLSITAPDIIQAGAGNTLGFPTPVTGDSACKGADITATFTGAYGVGEVSWEGPAVYLSDGVNRYVSRKPASAGSSSNPACCGGSISWTGADGCGGEKVRTTIIQPAISGHSFSPPDKSSLSEGVIYEFLANGACACSDHASLELSPVCLANHQGPLIRQTGALKRSFNQALTLDSTPPCASCCGAGAINLTFNNGCGGVAQASYTVRKGLNFNASNLLVGKRFRCQRYYVIDPSPRYVYDIEMAHVYCDGRTESYSRVYDGVYSSATECASRINGSQAPLFTSDVALSGLDDAGSCLFYSDNAQTQMSLVSGIFSVLDKCCEPTWGNGVWIRRSDSSRCCPN